MKQAIALILSAAWLCAASLSAQTQSVLHPLTLNLEPSKTRIEWTLDDVLHQVHGTFQLQRGRVTFDPRTGAAGGLIVVSAASGESGNGARDRKMQKEELQSDRYPDITFKPQQATGYFNFTGDSNLAVHGIFSLHGVEHPLTMNIALHATPSSGVISAATTFDLPYLAWGIKDPSTFILRVGKTVRIKVQTQGNISTR